MKSPLVVLVISEFNQRTVYLCVTEVFSNSCNFRCHVDTARKVKLEFGSPLVREKNVKQGDWLVTQGSY